MKANKLLEILQYYSKQKRPDYSEIQKKTNMFFPGVFRKK